MIINISRSSFLLRENLARSPLTFVIRSRVVWWAKKSRFLFSLIREAEGRRAERRHGALMRVQLLNYFSVGCICKYIYDIRNSRIKRAL